MKNCSREFNEGCVIAAVPVPQVPPIIVFCHYRTDNYDTGRSALFREVTLGPPTNPVAPFVAPHLTPHLTPHASPL